MFSTAWGQRLRSAVEEPLIVYELRWTADVPRADILEGQLDNAFERVGSPDRSATWRKNNLFFFDDQLTVTADGDVRVTRELGRWAWYVFGALILLAPALVTTLWSLPLYVGAVIIVESGRYTDCPVPACTEAVTDQTNGILGVIELLTVVTAIIGFLELVQHWMAIVLCAVAFGISVTGLYLQDRFPFVSPDLAKRPMTIPFSFLSGAFGTTVLFFPIVFFAVTLDRLGSFLGSYAEGETSQATASVLADLTGGLSGPPGEVNPEMVRQAILQLFTPILWLAIVTAVLVFVLWLSQAKSIVESFYQYRLQTFQSSAQRVLTFLLFVGYSAIIYATAIVATGVLLYGITGVYHLPPVTLRPLVVLLPAELSTSTSDFLAGLYRTLDSVFADIPVLPARVVSLSFLAGLLWPFIFVVIGTVSEVLGRPYRALRVLARSTPLSAETQSLVASDIQVRRIDCDGYPDLRPLSVLFGTREYILVSDIVVAECSQEELQGLLRHEQYHLHERSLGFGAIVLSSFLGGGNLLPAFYDFRQSERKADAAAAAIVGRKTLRHAIIRLYDLRARVGPSPICVQHPSIVGREFSQYETDRLLNETSNAVERLLATLRAYLVAPYQLYFGGILLDTAHMTKRARLAALRAD